MEKAKKRLARISAQTAEAQKEALPRDILPVADALDLVLLHLSHKEENIKIIQAIEMKLNLLGKFFTKYEVAQGSAGHDKVTVFVVFQTNVKESICHIFRQELQFQYARTGVYIIRLRTANNSISKKIIVR